LLVDPKDVGFSQSLYRTAYVLPGQTGKRGETNQQTFSDIHEDTSNMEGRRGCGFWCTVATVGVLVFGLIFFFMHEISDTPHYSIAINSVAGLDDPGAGGRRTLDPEFELTLGIASRAVLMGTQCVYPDMEVEVSYRGVLLATSVPAKQLCAEPRTHKEQRLLAYGIGVRLPASVQDSLAADVRRGVQIYDVAVRFPHSLEPCGPRQVGHYGSLPSPCD
jgi:hypothetical protein